jgi:hypothetical protein
MECVIGWKPILPQLQGSEGAYRLLPDTGFAAKKVFLNTVNGIGVNPPFSRSSNPSEARYMNKKYSSALFLASAVVLFLLPVSPAEAGRIRNRRERQQDRIAQGVESGQLTPRETARLEGREAALDRSIARKRSDGSLSPREHARIERRQNRISRGVYRQKHDGQTR